MRELPWERESGQQENCVEYRVNVEELRQRIRDYYGTAMYGGFCAAGADLLRADSMSDEAVVAEALRLGLLR